MILRATATETGGELLEMGSVYARPFPSRPPAHHHRQKRFEALCGAPRAARRRRGAGALRAGEVLAVPPGTPHEMWAESGRTRVSWRTYPAPKTEAFFEILWGLARDGRTTGRGVPNLPQMAVIARGYSDESRLAKPPYPV